MVVLGEAGIGKTRLVERNQCRGIQRAAPAYCWDAATRASDPALRSLGRRPPGGADRAEFRGSGYPRASVAGRAGAATSRAGPPEISASAAATATCDSSRDGSTPFGARRHTAVVAIIEDLHWADEMSIRLLPFLAAAARKSDGACSWRRPPRGEWRTLRRCVGRSRSWLTESRITQLTLPALSRAKTVDTRGGLAQRGTVTWRSRTAPSECGHVSEGNPFVVVETTRGDPRGPIIEQSTALPLPERVRDDRWPSSPG